MQLFVKNISGRRNKRAKCALLTDLIGLKHVAKNNKYEKKTVQHDLLRLSVWILGSSPVCAGLHLIKFFNLDHLN